jgi:uncharacterized membrane protein YeaQ/YmgE (transglycosylase-associated protein family)
MIGWIFFGLLVGALAKLVMPGRDPGGIILTSLLGMAGAVLGGFLGRSLGWYGPADSAGFLIALPVSPGLSVHSVLSSSPYGSPPSVGL